MTGVLDPLATNKLAKICGMFGSAHEGERASAAALADRTVRDLGLTWADVIGVPLVPAEPSHEDVSWQDALEVCLGHIGELTPRDRDFIRSLSRWRGEPSQKQQIWLFDVHARIRRGGR
jgi:hypothetical protein